MKIAFVLLSTLALLANAKPASDEVFGVAAWAKDPDMHPAGVCDGDDTFVSAEIEEAIIESLGAGGGDRRLQGQNIPWCKLNCQNFAPGTCHWAYPWCYPLRRALREGEPRFTETADELEEFNDVECARAVLAVKDKLVSLADLVQGEACKESLIDGHIFKCFKHKKN